MTKKNRFQLLGTAIAVAGLFAVQGVSAAPLILTNGDKIQLDWNSPSLGHAFGGGEFRASGVSVLNGAGDSFLTFCVEFPEHISLSTAYYVKINTGAVNGGFSTAATYSGDTAGTSSFDPLSKATAWLYTAFRGGTLGGFVADNAHANSLQLAFWRLENELGADVNALNAYNADITAKNWVSTAIAQSASWTDTRGVRVLNLYDTYNATTHVFSGNHQDQLYLAPIPEPESYAMLLAGLGLMGFIARRRRNKQ